MRAALVVEAMLSAALVGLLGAAERAVAQRMGAAAPA
jgi:hypothetical protein